MNQYGYLAHHGIKGQKWGVMNGSPYPLKSKNIGEREKVIKNLKNAKTSNLEKWGKDAEHNTLYIFGQSGSGKSTTALGLAKKNDTVIHLDGYSEPGEISSVQNKKFNSYLDKTVPKWREIARSAEENSKSDIKRFSKEYWNLVDGLRNAIESYSIKEFKNGNRVIVEGVQLSDEWFGGGSGYFKGKASIFINSGILNSMKRANERDGRNPNALKALLSFDDPIEVLKWRFDMNKSINDIAIQTGAKKGEKIVEQIISSL